MSRSTGLYVVFLHEFSDGFGMSSTDDDVVVADGMLEQIRLQVDVQGDLRTTEMFAVGRFDGFSFGDEITVQLRAAPFK